MLEIDEKKMEKISKKTLKDISKINAKKLPETRFNSK